MNKPHIAVQINPLEWECTEEGCGRLVRYDREKKVLKVIRVGNPNFEHQYQRDWLDPYRKFFIGFKER